MKKAFFLLLSLFLLSCSRTDSDSNTTPNPIVGKWQKNKFSSKKSPYSTATEQDCGLSECSKKYTLELNSNNTYKRYEYDGTSCSNVSISTGNYAYNSQANTFKIDNIDYEIQLSGTELKLISYSNYGCDASNPGQYQLIMTYKRVN